MRLADFKQAFDETVDNPRSAMGRLPVAGACTGACAFIQWLSRELYTSALFNQWLQWGVDHEA